MTRPYFREALGVSPPENYQRHFVPHIGEPIATDLIRRADLAAGERVLDVGCGTGVVTRLAAEKVGPEGSVTGLDVNPGMLAVARAVTPDELGIEWHQAGAEAMPFADGAFDVVLCQMSLQFVEDKAAALGEMRRVLVEGGRLVLNVPGPAAPVFEAMAAAMRQHIPPAAGFVSAVFAISDAGALERMLNEAGFSAVESAVQMHELRLPPARQFLWQYIGGTPLIGMVGQADEAARDRLEDDVVAAWRQYEDGDALVTSQRVVTVTGQR